MSDTSLVFNILAKEKVTNTLNKIKGAAAVAGVAIGAALAGGAMQMLEKSKLDATLSAQLGAGPEFAAELGKMSAHLYAQGFGADIGQVNAALKGVWQGGLIAEDAATADIERVAGKVTNLTTVMEEDASRVSMSVSQMLRTGMAKSAEEAFDILQRGVENGNNKAQDLLDTFNEYGTQFRKLGLDGTRSMGLISQAIKAGARDSDVAADALKEFSIRAIDGSKLTADGFKMLGLDASRMAQQIAAGGPAAAAGLDTVLDRLRAIKDPVKQSQAAVALFGTQAEDLGKALLAMDPSAAVDAMGNVQGAAERAGKTLAESAGAKLDTFKRKAQMALVEQLAKAVPYIEATFGWLQRNSGWVRPLAIGLGVLATAIYAIVVAQKVWTAVQWLLNLSLWSSPITWIVLAVAALVAIIVLIATKTDWFQRLWSAAWGWIQGAVSAVWGWIKTNWPLILAVITGPIGLAVLAVVKNWDRIKAATSAVKDWIVGRFNAVVSFFRGLPGKIANAARGMWDGIKNAFRSAINWIIDRWNGLSFRLPAVSVPGIGRIGGATLSTPNIPRLATGGDVLRSGLAVIHEGERVVPAAQVTRGPRGAGGQVTVVIDVRGADSEMLRLMRKLVRVEGGGNVQVAFGRG